LGLPAGNDQDYPLQTFTISQLARLSGEKKVNVGGLFPTQSTKMRREGEHIGMAFPVMG